MTPEAMNEEERKIAALLAGTDFSASYGERAALRRRLIAQMGEARGAWSPSGDKTAMTKRNWRLVFAAIIMTIVSVVALSHPALADSREHIVMWMNNGSLPEDVVAVVSFTNLPEGVAAVVNFESGHSTVGDMDESGDTEITQEGGPDITVSSFEEAQAAATFKLKHPTALPEGFSLKSITVTHGGAKVTMDYTNRFDGMLKFTQTTIAPVYPDMTVISPEPGQELPDNVQIVEQSGPVPTQEGEPWITAPVGQAILWFEGGVSYVTDDAGVYYETDEGGIYYEIMGTVIGDALQAVVDSLE